MIRNNLSILMSERGIKNSTLSLKTGISKNTISSTAQNDGKMIQLETINKICQVLKVEPGDFFSYLPYDVEIIFSLEEFEPHILFDELGEWIKLSFDNLTVDMFIKVSNTTEDIALFEFTVTPDFGLKENLFRESNKLFLGISQTDNNISEFQRFWKNIPTAFQNDIENILKKEFSNFFRTNLENYLFGELEKGKGWLQDDEVKMVIKNSDDFYELIFKPLLSDGLPF